MFSKLISSVERCQAEVLEVNNTHTGSMERSHKRPYIKNVML